MSFRKVSGILCGALCLSALSASLLLSGCAADEKASRPDHSHAPFARVTAVSSCSAGRYTLRYSAR